MLRTAGSWIYLHFFSRAQRLQSAAPDRDCLCSAKPGAGFARPPDRCCEGDYLLVIGVGRVSQLADILFWIQISCGTGQTGCAVVGWGRERGVGIAVQIVGQGKSRFGS